MQVSKRGEACSVSCAMDRMNAEKVPFPVSTPDVCMDEIKRAIKMGLNEHLSKPVNAVKGFPCRKGGFSPVKDFRAK